MPGSTQNSRIPLTPYVNRLSLKNRLARLAWGIVYRSLFRPTPRFMFSWRRLLLRCFGAKMGARSVVHASVRIWAPWNLEMEEFSCLAFDVDCYCVDKVKIGRRATVSQYAFLCTASHDIDDPQTPLVTGPITIGENAWVFAGAFVGPGVSLGEGAVAAARSVVVRDVPAWTVVGGNPARVIRARAMKSSSFSPASSEAQMGGGPG